MKNGILLIVQSCLILLSIYPIVGSVNWFIGGLSYKYLRKSKKENLTSIIDIAEPFITIMVPAHNEEIMIADTIKYLSTKLNYKNYEILVLNDASTDSTLEILKSAQKKFDNLRIINIEQNKGKAHAFNIGIAFARGEYILSNDADTLPETNALKKYMHYFLNSTDLNTAAVTANMDVQNRTTLLGKSQTVEFSSIVGIIKRTQTAVNNSMYAYSGANTMYRKKFLVDVGGFRQNRITEDISIAWDHQKFGVIPKFAPEILFHMNVPEKLGELYKQRKRWAQGGIEVWLTYFNEYRCHPIKHKFQMSMFLDSTLAIVWSFFYIFSSIFFLLSIVYFSLLGDFNTVWTAFIMSFIFLFFEMCGGLLQLITALLLDNQGVKMKYLLFAPLYMLLFWIVNPLTIVTRFIPAVKTLTGKKSGVWKSPERKKINLR